MAKRIQRLFTGDGISSSISDVKTGMEKSCSQYGLLADLVDLSVQHERDQIDNYRELHRRDRRIGLAFERYRNRPIKQIACLLAKLREQGGLQTGHRFAIASKLISIIMTVAGLLSGWSAAAVVFYYDGTRPVNVVHVLAVFVFLQLLLLGLLLLSFLLMAMRRWLPVADQLSGLVRLISPGRIAPLIVSILPRRYRRAMQSIAGRVEVHQKLYHHIQQWLIMNWSQRFALAFNIAAVLCVLYLITFTDLAFAWSTTLEVDASNLHTITECLASPWSTWQPQANPSHELIASTRYFRFQEGSLPGMQQPSPDLRALGQWWPFLLYCMIVYGLIPRAVIHAITSWKLRSEIRRSILRLPGTRDLLDRMNTEVLHWHSDEPESLKPSERNPIQQTGHRLSLADRSCRVINWSSVPIDEVQTLSSLLRCTITAVYQAGGSRTVEQDKQVIDQFGRLNLKDEIILLLTRSWEPPMLELVDFVKQLRETSGEGIAIAVLPLAFNDGSEPAAPSPACLRPWQDRFQSIGDPWVSVVNLNEVSLS